MFEVSALARTKEATRLSVARGISPDLKVAKAQNNQFRCPAPKNEMKGGPGPGTTPWSHLDYIFENDFAVSDCRQILEQVAKHVLTTIEAA